MRRRRETCVTRAASASVPRNSRNWSANLDWSVSVNDRETATCAMRGFTGSQAVSF